MILGEAVEDAGREGVGGNDPTGDKAIQRTLDRKLVVAHPPVGNSPGGVHGGLVLKQEEDNLLGKWIRAKGGRDGVCHTFPQPRHSLGEPPRRQGLPSLLSLLSPLSQEPAGSRQLAAGNAQSA